MCPITVAANYYGVRTASRLVSPSLFEQGYRKLRVYSMEISLASEDGDSGNEDGQEIYVTEPALIVGWHLISRTYPLADPGANDMEVATNAIIFGGVSGGNIEFAEVMSRVQMYAIGVVAQMNDKVADKMFQYDYNMRWPLDDGDKFYLRLTYFNSNGGAVAWRHYAEGRLYVAEKA